jgi:hypothetical protein
LLRQSPRTLSSVSRPHLAPSVRTLRSAHPDLERAAIEAVSQWEFTPTLLNCSPVEVRMTATVNFAP